MSDLEEAQSRFEKLATFSHSIEDMLTAAQGEIARLKQALAAMDLDLASNIHMQTRYAERAEQAEAARERLREALAALVAEWRSRFHETDDGAWQTLDCANELAEALSTPARPTEDE